MTSRERASRRLSTTYITGAKVREMVIARCPPPPRRARLPCEPARFDADATMPAPPPHRSFENDAIDAARRRVVSRASKNAAEDDYQLRRFRSHARGRRKDVTLRLLAPTKPMPAI